jgi:hypothetical protein
MRKARYRPPFGFVAATGWKEDPVRSFLAGMLATCLISAALALASVLPAPHAEAGSPSCSASKPAGDSVCTEDATLDMQ